MISTYKNCLIDYCLIEDDTPHQGYRSHKDAILFAMLKVIERYIDEQLMSEIRYRREIGEEPTHLNCWQCRKSCAQTGSDRGFMPAVCRIL